MQDPWKVVVDNQIITIKSKVLEKLKKEFELISNPSNVHNFTDTNTSDDLNDTDNSMLNLKITTAREYGNALNRAKRETESQGVLLDH